MINKQFINAAARTGAILTALAALMIFGAAGCRSGTDAPAPATAASAPAATVGKSPNQIANDLAMRTGHSTQSSVAAAAGATAAPMSGPITGTPNQMAAELARRSFGAKSASSATPNR